MEVQPVALRHPVRRRLTALGILAGLAGEGPAGRSLAMASLIARCQKLTERDARAALLLLSILDWLPKAKAQHNGHVWIAKSALEWCTETGLSLKQYHRTIAKLRQLGLVKTKQHLPGEKNVTHLRLEGAALELVPAQAQPGTEAPGKSDLPASGKAVLTGNGNPDIPKSGNLAASGDPLSSGSEQPTPPASGDPVIPGIGNPGIGNPEIGKIVAGGQLCLVMGNRLRPMAAKHRFPALGNQRNPRYHSSRYSLQRRRHRPCRKKLCPLQIRAALLGGAHRLLGLCLQIRHALAQLVDDRGDLTRRGLHGFGSRLVQANEVGGHAAERLHVGGSAGGQHGHGLALDLEEELRQLLDLGQGLVEAGAQPSRLIGRAGGRRCPARRLELAPEVSHRLLHYAELALGAGAHALGDDLAGTAERFEHCAAGRRAGLRGQTCPGFSTCFRPWPVSPDPW